MIDSKSIEKGRSAALDVETISSRRGHDEDIKEEDACNEDEEEDDDDHSLPEEDEQ